MKKKLIAILFAIVFVATTSSCLPKNVSINAISVDYLSELNVKNSRIKRMDYNEISRYDNELPVRDLNYISLSIDEVLEPFYNISLIENRCAASGDVILFDLEITDSFGTSVCFISNVKMLIGSDVWGWNIETAMIGKAKNQTYRCMVDKTIKELLKVDNAYQIFITIIDIYQYVEKMDTPEFLFNNGFSSFQDFYIYLVEMKIGEHDYEKNSMEKEKFIDFAAEACEFFISEEDITSYSLQIVNEHKQAAESLSLTLDEYYANVLFLDESAFFLMCTDSAEQEIKKCLIIGALSQYFNIDVNDEYFKEFCTNNSIDVFDSTLVLFAQYYCLENAVIENFVYLY